MQKMVYKASKYKVFSGEMNEFQNSIQDWVSASVFLEKMLFAPVFQTLGWVGVR